MLIITISNYVLLYFLFVCFIVVCMKELWTGNLPEEEQATADAAWEAALRSEARPFPLRAT